MTAQEADPKPRQEPGGNLGVEPGNGGGIIGPRPPNLGGGAPWRGRREQPGQPLAPPCPAIRVEHDLDHPSLVELGLGLETSLHPHLAARFGAIADGGDCRSQGVGVLDREQEHRSLRRPLPGGIL